jgi:hypothetical protein
VVPPLAVLAVLPQVSTSRVWSSSQIAALPSAGELTTPVATSTTRTLRLSPEHTICFPGAHPAMALPIQGRIRHSGGEVVPIDPFAGMTPAPDSNITGTSFMDSMASRTAPAFRYLAPPRSRTRRSEGADPE